MIVVCDSTILIGLAKLGKLDLLKETFHKVFIPKEVFKEVVERGKGKPGYKTIKKAAWIETKTVKDKIQVAFLQGSLGACPKMPFFLNSLSCEKNYPRNINYIPAVIFFAFLDLRKNYYSRTAS